MPRTDHHAIFQWPRSERCPHVWAEVIDRLVTLFGVKHGDGTTPDVKSLTLAFGDITNFCDGMEFRHGVKLVIWAKTFALEDAYS